MLLTQVHHSYNPVCHHHPWAPMCVPSSLSTIGCAFARWPWEHENCCCLAQAPPKVLIHPACANGNSSGQACSPSGIFICWVYVCGPPSPSVLLDSPPSASLRTRASMQRVPLSHTCTCTGKKHRKGSHWPWDHRFEKRCTYPNDHFRPGEEKVK